MLILSACGQGDPQGARTPQATPHITRANVAWADRAIPCSAGGPGLTARCTVDREATARGLLLTLGRPDGGFRRLLVTRDGRGVVAADGAAPARVAVAGPDLIEVSVAGERYRLPATVKAVR